jgi:hypothetical protein
MSYFCISQICVGLEVRILKTALRYNKFYTISNSINTYKRIISDERSYERSIFKVV